ncbi:MAG: hypothetical protein ACK4S2_11210 [Gemmobacter sp.]|uniref:hypothetical protein n=1 Tax=Gemmobacter sp. TaxID=1898957 RepID=UPI003918C476
MHRRRLILGLVAVLAAGPLSAQSLADRVTRDLQRQGLTSIETSRTLLGRTRIVGTGPEGRREVILNPRTGEILRDLWQPSGTGSGGGLLSTRDDDHGGEGRGRGRGRGGDDDGGSGSGDDGDDGDSSGGDDKGGDDD